MGHRSDTSIGVRRRPVVVYGDGAERGREEESGDVQEDQQLTSSTKSSTAKHGEAGRRRIDARTAAAGGGRNRSATANPGLPPRFLGRGGSRQRGGARGGINSLRGGRSRRHGAVAGAADRSSSNLGLGFFRVRGKGAGEERGRQRASGFTYPCAAKGGPASRERGGGHGGMALVKTL